MDIASHTAWIDLGVLVAKGQAKIEQNDILAIATALDFSAIKSEYLPVGNLSNRKNKIQKQAGLNLASKLWGLADSDFMDMEKKWLAEARQRVGSTKDDDKVESDDLVTPQILTRIYTVAYLFHLASLHLLGEDDYSVRELCDQALVGLNLFIANCCYKGYTRVQKLQIGSGKAIATYNLLRDFCIPVGVSGKFLPDPETSLPDIFLMFQREKLHPEVYRPVSE